MPKQFLSIFLLLSFLFPQIHKSLHEFSHRDDDHCHEVLEKHFHEYEHSCPICDYKVPVSNVNEFVIADQLISEYFEVVVYYQEQYLVSASWKQQPPRAPPV